MIQAHLRLTVSLSLLASRAGSPRIYHLLLLAATYCQLSHLVEKRTVEE